MPLHNGPMLDHRRIHSNHLLSLLSILILKRRLVAVLQVGMGDRATSLSGPEDCLERGQRKETTHLEQGSSSFGTKLQAGRPGLEENLNMSGKRPLKF